ncbi:MAG TPA: hypothetical protein VIT23_00550, partial [Terrimicrobiaceae bacterium]
MAHRSSDPNPADSLYDPRLHLIGASRSEAGRIAIGCSRSRCIDLMDPCGEVLTGRKKNGTTPLVLA